MDNENYFLARKSFDALWANKSQEEILKEILWQLLSKEDKEALITKPSISADEHFKNRKKDDDGLPLGIRTGGYAG